MNLRFKRYEKKFLLTKEQYHTLLDSLAIYIEKDVHHKYTIRNIYYDDDSYKVIRHSISKPVYKQKFRLRTYDNQNIFLEIKKKYNKEVFKRRVVLDMNDFYNGDFSQVEDVQTLEEIKWYVDTQELFPKVSLSYDRLAYHAKEDRKIRITFDTNLYYSIENLDLRMNDVKEKDYLEGNVVMEIKVEGAVPLWLTEILTKSNIYSRPFSKYGYCYKKNIIDEPIKA